MRYHRQSEELEPAPAVPATADGIVIVGGGGMDATDGDADSGLMVSGRTGSRVPRPLAWAQLILGVLGFVLGATDVGIRAAAGASNATVVAFHSVRPVQAFDVTGAFGFPIWCSLSMLVSSGLALWYANTQLQRMLRLYRLYSLFNLGIQSVGCLLLVVAWIALSQPSDSPSPDPTGVSPSQSPLQPQQQEHQQLRVFLALCSMVLTASWLLVLACVSCDWCVGKNLLQVLGIFVRTVFHRSQRDSFSELKRSTNSLNSMHMEPVGARKRASTHRHPPHSSTATAAVPAATAPAGVRMTTRRPSLLEATWQMQTPSMAAQSERVSQQRAAATVVGGVANGGAGGTVGLVRSLGADEDSISRELDFGGNETSEQLTGLLARHKAGLA
ncbi:hypothetical protein BOX15_Mlig002145g5 [Macrostomum lignano]|uniref:Uncharacterized protein n=1 Tax=Macrostomum lignano TaxID=282301 RepID=A0A267EG36_9PLAT|nr:hypothetical protein BOX15_Mlig002145g5 [Macrostomum lignano]